MKDQTNSMKNLFPVIILLVCLSACNSEKSNSVNSVDNKKVTEAPQANSNAAAEGTSVNVVKGDTEKQSSTAASNKSAETIREEKSRNSGTSAQRNTRASNTTSEEYQDSYTSTNSIDVSGLYRCSSEDMIRINSNGTGRMIMSYSFDGVRSFTWDYDRDDETLSIRSEPPEELKYEMPPLYMTLHLRMVNGRVAFEHYTAGPTFLYIKQ